MENPRGAATIRGLRYPVENMLELLAAGMTRKSCRLFGFGKIGTARRGSPPGRGAEADDLLACLEYAVKVTQTKTIENFLCL